MKNKLFNVKVKNENLIYGKGTEVTKREAQQAFEEGFMKAAKKKRDTKYKGYAGINFQFMEKEED